MNKNKKTPTFINIKAMLMMLVMMFVGFGIFGGNVFALDSSNITTNGTTHTITISEGTHENPYDGVVPIEVQSGHKYILNITGGTVETPYEGFFKIPHEVSVENVDIEVNMSGGTVRGWDGRFNFVYADIDAYKQVVQNCNFTFNVTGGTLEGSNGIDFIRTYNSEYSGETSPEFKNNTINVNLSGASLNDKVQVLRNTGFQGGTQVEHNTVNLTIGNDITDNGVTEFSVFADGGNVYENTVNYHGNGSSFNGSFYYLNNINDQGSNTLNIYALNTNFSDMGNNMETAFINNYQQLFNSNYGDGWYINDRRPISSPSENASTGTGTNNADGTVTVQIPITKLMHMNAADATILNDYTFTMTPAEAVHTQDSYTGATSPAQTDNTVTIHKEAFNRITSLNENNNKVVISNVNNNGTSGVDNDVFTLTFTNGQIGQFHYHVVETPITSGLQSGVTQDSTLYDIVVTIENKDPNNITSGEVKFAGVTMSTSTDGGNTWTKTNTGESTKSDRGGAGVDINNAKFTNTFHTADVLVDKTVRGSLGDKTKDFTFTFNVQGTNIPTTYKLYKTNAANETAEPVDVQNGSTFTLKHNESAKVMGLPEGASYRITETGTADYTTNISASVGDSEFVPYYTLVNDTAVACNSDMYSEVAGQTGGENIYVSKYDNEGSDISITAASNLDQQHFTNMKGQLIPTGLIENMASFLGLALLAAFAVGYMLYKKKKDTVSEEA